MIKKIIIPLMTLCVACLAFATVTNDDRPVSYEQLPHPIKTFMTIHFPDNKMAYADKDWGGYDVILTSGTELEFNSKGVWTKAEARREVIPESILKLLPENLTNYIEQTYPDKSIKTIEIKRSGYEIELSGMHDFELRFDKKGRFLYIDD
jgi:Protein of unknown function (DUF2874).